MATLKTKEKEGEVNDSLGPNYVKDEPTFEDGLDRDKYAQSLARLCETCDTPLVVGIYATWGVGKTSLMQLIERSLDKDQHHVIWFNLWEHQFVDNPVLALAHVIADSVDDQAQAELKKLLTLIGAALGGQLLKMSTGMKLLELLKLGSIYEEEHFQTRDVSMRLKEHLQKLIRRVHAVTGKKRIVFFIDDLDRCSPGDGLKLLDSLKLYLNLKGSIYFIGVDKQALQESVRTKYADNASEGINYLDKIIQLPFTVPLVEPEQLKTFIESLLTSELWDCQTMLEKGLGGNPRQVKRFINSLLLNHQLACEKIDEYQSPVLCALLMIQYRKPELYSMISQRPELLFELLAEDEAGGELRTNYLGDDLELEEVLRLATFPPAEKLQSYMYLTDTAGIKPEVDKVGSAYSQNVFSEEAMAIQEEDEFLSEQGLVKVLEDAGALAQGERMVDSLKILHSPTQRTWLLATQLNLYCLLDDPKTRAGGRVLQWKQKLQPQLFVRAYQSEKGSTVVDIGARRRWLYSRRLFPEPKALERRISELVETALAASAG